MSKVCALTGATGLVGSHCHDLLIANGYRVIKLQRSNTDKDTIRFNLGDAIGSDVFQGVGTLIHCAYDYKARSWDEIYNTNVLGSIKLMQAAADAGVKKIVYISSVAAFVGCHSLYGQGKLRVEEFVAKIDGIIVRPGMVYGDPQKGIYGSLYRLTRFPVLPLFSGGHQPMLMVHVEDLAKALKILIESESNGKDKLFTAAHAEPIEFRELLRGIAKKRGRSIRFVSVPTSIAMLGLKLPELLGLKLDFKSDGLVSLLYTNPKMDFEATQRIKFSFRSFWDSCFV